MDEDIREEDLFNPHDDAEPFFRDILQQGNDSKGHSRLAPSLHRLVALLRETLPVVVELEAIRRDEEKRNRVIDTFPKAVGWYRLLYGDLRYVYLAADVRTCLIVFPFRHALDFRLMTKQRIAILDGSYSLHPSSSSFAGPTSVTKPPISSSSTNTTTPVANSTPKKSNARTFGESSHGVLQPIPYFREIIAEVAMEGLRRGDIRPGKIARVDSGVVCECAAVHKLSRAIHSRVVEVLVKNAAVSGNGGVVSGLGGSAARLGTSPAKVS